MDIINGLTSYAEVVSNITTPSIAESLISNYVPIRNRFGYDGMGAGTKVVNLIDFGSTKDDLTDCCNTGTTTDDFVQVSIPVACVAKHRTYCVSDLDSLKSKYDYTAGQESIGNLVSEIADALRVSAAQGGNDLLMNGVSSANAGTDQIDGLIQQLTGKAVTAAYTTGSVKNMIDNVISKLPADALKYVSANDPLLIFVGADAAMRYQSQLIVSNLWNPVMVGDKEVNAQEYEVPGFANVKVIAINALSGLGKGIAVASGLLASGVNEASLSTVHFQKLPGFPVNFQWYMQGLAGIGVAKPEDAVLFTFTADVLNAPNGLPVDVVATVAGA